MAGAIPSGLKFPDVRSELKTGDIVLFSGSSFTSSVIKWGIGGPAFPDRVLLANIVTIG